MKKLTPQIDALIMDLRAFLDRDGKRNCKRQQLASHLGVAPARISEWLAHKTKPNGETTLRLIQWLKEQS